MDKIYVVTDLGPGDGGKGGIVHALSCTQDNKVNLIIKRGGAQGSHGVRTSYKESFNFSQWGCGTLEAIPTYCSEQMIISPVGLRNESEALKRLGIANPFLLLSVDPSCICATPFHMISSQLEELRLGKNPRGTVGTGVGRAYRLHNEEDGEQLTLRAKELKDPSAIRRKLQLQCEYYRTKYYDVTERAVLPEDAVLARENLDLLADNGYLQYCIELFKAIGKELSFSELPQMLEKDGNAIIECSHGVLTDAEVGLKPHVSAIRTLPKFTNEMLRSVGYDGKIINLAVHRAYEIRHGAGPMPTYDADFTKVMLPGSHKGKNRWQGIVRAGALDLNLVRYALDCCKETLMDGLCLTWFDQIISNKHTWPICIAYQNMAQVGEDYVDFLKTRAKPEIKTYSIKDTKDGLELFHYVEDVLQEYISLPLKMLSIGPTELDKISSEKI